MAIPDTITVTFSTVHLSCVWVGYEWIRKLQEPEGLVRVVFNVCFAIVLSFFLKGWKVLPVEFPFKLMEVRTEGSELSEHMTGFYLLNLYDIGTTPTLYGQRLLCLENKGQPFRVLGLF